MLKHDLKRTLAGILTAAMVMSSVTPAYAA